MSIFCLHSCSLSLHFLLSRLGSLLELLGPVRFESQIEPEGNGSAQVEGPGDAHPQGSRSIHEQVSCSLSVLEDKDEFSEKDTN